MNVIAMQQQPSFLQKLVASEGGEVRYIVGTENDRACWFFLKLTPAKYREYKQSFRQKQANLKEFGDVLLCGWGESAPELAKRLMRKKYGAVC